MAMITSRPADDGTLNAYCLVPPILELDWNILDFSWDNLCTTMDDVQTSTTTTANTSAAEEEDDDNTGPNSPAALSGSPPATINWNDWKTTWEQLAADQDAAKTVCPVCGIKYKNRNDMVKHWRKLHPESAPSRRPKREETEKRFECPHCGKRFARKEHLDKHVVPTGCNADLIKNKKRKQPDAEDHGDDGDTDVRPAKVGKAVV
ncbi:hypothetical protein GE09DRAFT_1294119 [Coniochaeta sp. 2T2.1]|nr:hypothetical protein GE09DRAFT_1294119 [Coniochaeta sp. 2T2.1]